MANKKTTTKPCMDNLKIKGLPMYKNELEAGKGGLIKGDIYMIPTNEIRSKL